MRYLKSPAFTVGLALTLVSASAVWWLGQSLIMFWMASHGEGTGGIGAVSEDSVVALVVALLLALLGASMIVVGVVRVRRRL